MNYPGGPSVITRVLIKGGGSSRVRKRKEGGNMTTETEGQRE